MYLDLYYTLLEEWSLKYIVIFKKDAGPLHHVLLFVTVHHKSKIQCVAMQERCAVDTCCCRWGHQGISEV